MKLPQELFDVIIDNLDNYPWALPNSSLVCHSWLHPSRRCLFRRIVLLPPPKHAFRGSAHVSHCQRLHWLLLDSPHIATYIRELKIYEGQMEKHQAWIASDPTLPPVLGLLRDLTKLEIRRLIWKVLPNYLRQSICHVLELPSLTSFEIEHADFGSIDDFAGLLSHAEGLTCLTLTEITVRRQSLAQEDMKHGTVEKEGVRSNHGRRRLLDLRLNSTGYFGIGYPELVDWLLGPQSSLELSHIRTLHILHYGRSDALPVNKLLYAIGSSLRHFKLNDPGDVRSL